MPGLMIAMGAILGASVEDNGVPLHSALYNRQIDENRFFTVPRGSLKYRPGEGRDTGWNYG